MKMKPFLTAHWRNLINLTYQVEPERLLPHLPSGLELDFWQGRAHVSLVAFEFLHTRVKGFKIPFHVNFPEINLRYYVRRREKRGVAFLREYVPKHCIALAANRLYNEPYQAVDMACQTQCFDDGMQIQYRLFRKIGIDIQTEIVSFIPPPSSIEHHFKEHELGYGKDKAGNTLCYHVAHPVWEIFRIRECRLGLEFGRMYGEAWAFLQQQPPVCALVAKGSWVTVFHPQKLESLDHQP